MKRILPVIDSLEQHQKQLRDNPDAYRPTQCHHCGKAGLHRHGFYQRNVPRGKGLAFWLGFLLIPRFYCSACRHTCSRIPGCLSPKRHYWWQCQQSVLMLLLAGKSIHAAAIHLPPSRHTIARWWRRLQSRFTQHRFHLCSRYPELGRHDTLVGFWSACLQQMSLASVMAVLGQDGEMIP